MNNIKFDWTISIFENISKKIKLSGLF